jgi:hypothetical protein
MKNAFLPSLLGLAFSASCFATVLTGPGGSGVAVGDSSLITTLDYSDIFTVGAEGTDRPWNGAPTTAGLVVENSYGNPTRSWPTGAAYGAAISDVGAYIPDIPAALARAARPE